MAVARAAALLCTAMTPDQSLDASGLPDDTGPVIEPGEVTRLLHDVRNGDRAALDRVLALIYDDLRMLARRQLRRELHDRTLDPTGLVHETYLKLIRGDGIDIQDRAHFFALAAQIMRRILIDTARARTASKRGGGAVRAEHSSAVDLDQIPADDSNAANVLCALDDALESLTQVDPRRAKVIELRFFGGLSVEETAEVLQVSQQTVMRDWRLARAWLARELRVDEPPEA